MSTCYITIKDAADLSGKSIQTIRRLIKSKKIKFKRDKTPQGFNYLIDKDAFMEFYNISRAHTNLNETVIPVETAEIKEETTSITLKQSFDAAVEFNETVRQMIKQHSTEKESLFKLIDSFQGKVIALENRLKIESEKANKPWYRIW